MYVCFSFEWKWHFDIGFLGFSVTKCNKWTFDLLKNADYQKCKDELILKKFQMHADNNFSSWGTQVNDHSIWS